MDTEEALDLVARWVLSVDWAQPGLTEPGTGACVPIAYTAQRLLLRVGVDARAWQTSVMAKRHGDVRYAEIEPMTDERGTFAGHMINYLPKAGLLVDASLWTQPTTTIRNLNPPHLLAIRWDHRAKRNTATADLPNGWVRYTLDRHNRTWQKLRWPWETLADAVDRFLKEIS